MSEDGITTEATEGHGGSELPLCPSVPSVVKITLRWGRVMITVDADLVAAHRLCQSSAFRLPPSALPREIDIVTAIELLEMQWQRRQGSRSRELGAES